MKIKKNHLANTIIQFNARNRNNDNTCQVKMLTDRQEVLPGAGEDGSAVKKIGCSCRGPVFSYRHYMVPCNLL